MLIPKQEYISLKKKIPILCVDLIVTNRENEILLLKRAYEPAKDKWWFPGGRVMHGETRIEAATRKLRDECGLESQDCVEWKTFDVFIPDTEEKYISHAVSTFYKIKVDLSNVNVKIDFQSIEYKWCSLEKIKKKDVDAFVFGILLNLEQF